jgi:anthranilate phosphoribosyltransferase
MNTLEKLIAKTHLNKEEAEHLVEQMMDGSVSSTQSAAILTAMRIKGETTEEILGFIHAMRKNMKTVKTEGIVIDTCGTGGDGSGTFNISTAVALVVAGAGVKVAKHGNRSASSKCGSADVLEALGVSINVTSDQAGEILEKAGMVFLFAPHFHPSMKQIGAVRKELGVRTIFNFLGPFSNPAGVKRQLIGVPNRLIAAQLAEVALHLDYDHLLILSHENGVDEIGLTGKTYVFEIKKGSKTINEFIIQPEEFGFHYSTKVLTQGGEAQENAVIITNILAGEKGPNRDVVVLNAAYALIVAGKVTEVSEGIRLAVEAIDTGRARRVLEKLIKN